MTWEFCCLSRSCPVALSFLFVFLFFFDGHKRSRHLFIEACNQCQQGSSIVLPLADRHQQSHTKCRPGLFGFLRTGTGSSAFATAMGPHGVTSNEKALQPGGRSADPNWTWHDGSQMLRCFWMVAPVYGAARSSNYPVRAADVDPKLHWNGSHCQCHLP